MKITTSFSCLLLLALLTNIGSAKDTAPKKKTKAECLAELKKQDEAAKKMSPVEYVQAIYDTVKDLDLVKVWAMFPKRHQKDINDVFHLAAKKMDKEVWDKSVTILKKLSRVLKEKEKFILYHIDDGIKLNEYGLNEDFLNSFITFYDAILESDLTDLEKVRKLHLGLFFLRLNPDFKKIFKAGIAMLQKRGLKELDTLLKNVNNAKISLKEKNGDVAILDITYGGETSVARLRKIDGKWFPQEAIDIWDTELKKIKDTINNISDEQVAAMKKIAIPVLSELDKGLDEVLEADTQEKFDSAVSKLYAKIIPQ